MRVLFSKFEESFAGGYIKKSLLQDDRKKEQKMDAVSTKAMLQEVNILTNTTRIINRHTTEFFFEDLFFYL